MRVLATVRDHESLGNINNEAESHPLLSNRLFSRMRSSKKKKNSRKFRFSLSKDAHGERKFSGFFSFPLSISDIEQVCRTLESAKAENCVQSPHNSLEPAGCRNRVPTPYGSRPLVAILSRARLTPRTLCGRTSSTLGRSRRPHSSGRFWRQTPTSNPLGHGGDSIGW